MENKAAVASGGITFNMALLLLFIGLKLGGAIDWPWIWVLSPAWIPVALFVAVLVVGVVFIILAAALGFSYGRR